MSSAPLPTMLYPGLTSTSPVRPEAERLWSNRSFSASTSCLDHKPTPVIEPRARSSLSNLDTFAELLESSTFDEILRRHSGCEENMLPSQHAPTRRRSQAYDEHLQHKENAIGGVRERVMRDFPIIAELRTNVIIKDEFVLVRDLTRHLAARYTRPDAAVMVQVDHSVCLALGGTFDPCYILTLTTGPSQMGPIMNRRNAALIQSFMADILGVPAERGVMKFQPSSEENFAYNGTTLLGEIERREKQHEKEHSLRRSVEYNSKKGVPSPRKSTSKPDIDIKRNDSTVQESPPAESKSAGSKVVEPKTLTAVRPKTSEGILLSKRTPASLPAGVSATILSPGGIYELPAGEAERTVLEQRQTSGSNGLRMNPVTQSESEVKRKASSGKPRAKSGDVLEVKEKRRSNPHLNARPDPLAAPAPPPIQRAKKSSLKHDVPHSFLQNEYTKHNSHAPRSSNINRMSAPIAMREKPMRMLGVRETYIESLMSKPHLAKVFGSEQTVSEEDVSKDMMDQEPTANTAKRRSTMTMTATTKIPETSQSNDSKSVKSARTGKRKSFMAAFRRNAVAV